VTREQIQDLLGMRIKNVSEYQRALVHKSIYKAVKRYEGPLQEYLAQHNERLEFLGDSVLDLIIANYLYHQYPDQDEGFLTKMKTKLVNGTQLAKIARTIGLGKYILMSNHVEKTLNGRDSQRILEDAFEAFLAALFKDLGFDAVNSYILGIINRMDFSDLMVETNYKDMLMKYSHKFFHNLTPEYQLLEVIGQPHNRTFKVVVTIDGKHYETGTAKSKKQAEQNACENTLKKLNVI
jgi:ribonuclease-3